MSENKTVPNGIKVDDFLDSFPEHIQTDSLVIIDIMQKATGELPIMWGDSIIGFGSLHYKYASGREGDTFLCGFSPRKGKFSIYFNSGFSMFERELEALGPATHGKSCLYVKKLEKINLDVLDNMIMRSVEAVSKNGLSY